jgi:hypothetical protein
MNITTPLYQGQLLSGASAADTTGIAIFPPVISGKMLETTLYVVFSSAAAAGTVLLESAHHITYSGTWATEATVSWAAGGTVKVAHLTAVNNAMRVRISSAITSGTVDVYAVCLGPS